MTTTIPGSVDPGAAMTNHFEWTLRGLPPIRFVSVGSLESRVKTARLSDGSAQATGRVDGVEVPVTIYLHHKEDLRALTAWHAESIANAPSAKKRGTLKLKAPNGTTIATVATRGAMLIALSTPDLDSDSDGEAVKVSGTVSIDQIKIRP